jgi:hypothetical protein
MDEGAALVSLPAGTGQAGGNVHRASPVGSSGGGRMADGTWRKGHDERSRTSGT